MTITAILHTACGCTKEIEWVAASPPDPNILMPLKFLPARIDYLGELPLIPPAFKNRRFKLWSIREGIYHYYEVEEK